MTIPILIGVLVVLAIAVYAVLSSKGNTPGTEADARRFAKLLITEIKLYENQKIERGLRDNNLGEVLHDKIENAREMYQKRILSPDYERFFDEALVEILANGDRNKLGRINSSIN